jgi:NAD kinase
VSLQPRVVLVHRRSELDELVDRHGTRGQVEFFLRTRGRTLAEVEARHERLTGARHEATATVPQSWRRASVERGDLYRFPFEPEDVVIVVGQDGLVANVAKYLDGQPVIGVDPDPGRNPGVLVTRAPGEAAALAGRAATGAAPVLERCLAEAILDDGQQLLALNEIYVGHASHQSARYTLVAPGGGTEAQSSSGLIAATGTGATGWARSIWLERGGRSVLPAAQERRLAWFTREAWPSPSTGTTNTEGLLGGDQRLELRIDSDALVVFGDGLETDRLTATWGQRVTIGLSQRVLRHVV